MKTTLMNAARSPETRLELDSAGWASVRKGRGGRICVERGAVWITQEGNPNDICVAAGQCYTIASDAPMVATALGDEGRATITIGPSEPLSRPAWRDWFPRIAAAARMFPVTPTRTA